MRVCFVSLSAYGYFDPSVDDFGGGAQRQLSLLARELADEFDVHLVVGDYGQEQTERRDGVTFHRAYEPGSGNQLSRTLSLFAAVNRACPDVIVYRGYPKKAVATYLLARLVGAAWVYNLSNDANLTSDPDNLPLPARRLFGHALRSADGVIAQTGHQADLLGSEYGVDSTVVPSGFPRPESTLSHDEREFLLWVGRLEAEQKRPHLYLDLAERVSDREFALVGMDGPDAEYNDRIHERAASLSNVTDVGAVDPDEVHTYFRRAVALVNTSGHEGFPSTFLEAWRYETPVISYEVDPDRFVEPSVDCFADGSFEGLVEHVRRLSTAVDAREQEGRAAAAYVHESLSVEAIGRQYADVLRRAARV